MAKTVIYKRRQNHLISQSPFILFLSSVQKDHATITNKKSVCVLKPSEGAKVLLNGKDLVGSQELHHNDR